MVSYCVCGASMLTESRVWSSLDTKGKAPPGCHHPLVTLHNNSLFIFGGKTDPNLHELDLESNTWTTVSYEGPSPKSSAPAGCVNDGNLVVLSSYNNGVSFKQFKLPERKAKPKTDQDLIPEKDGTVTAHLHSLVNNQLMSDVTFLGKALSVYVLAFYDFLTLATPLSARVI
ncbi:unnamed protein product [Phytophthora fragariaefolia]|uniref:Unnamed protein product n=1 Tax=Phytophthora fragariaefolia TaxID=1490495 RepID=A0A9W7DA07_9STRA|nr:unnamed protein product [Phytophthora fragariaefolia]